MKERLALVYPHETGTMLVEVDYEHEIDEAYDCEYGGEFGRAESFAIVGANYTSGMEVPDDIFDDEDVINDIFDLIEQRENLMNPTEYVTNALKTESMDMAAIAERLSDPMKVRLLHAALGLETEVGEIQDALKKHIFYGKKLDIVNLAEEMGDVFWYLAVLSDVLEAPFEQVMEKNIAKLRARYGDKFTSEKALNRDLETERKILES